MTSNRKITPQFKEECIAFALAHPDKPIAVLAKEFGVGKSTLAKWVHDHRLKNGQSAKRPLSAEQQQIAQLKKEVAHLQEVNEILKKATTYFAAQNGRRGTFS
jgi:transposase